MKTIDVHDALQRITKKDPRYDRDAYLFVREALDHTLKLRKNTPRAETIKVAREESPERKRMMMHVTGQELLEAVRDLALKQFGPLAGTVFEHWGVKRCEDIGEIVFNMVDVGLLGKTETDSKADFAGAYDFEEAFRKPYRPPHKKRSGADPDTGASESSDKNRSNQ